MTFKAPIVETIENKYQRLDIMKSGDDVTFTAEISGNRINIKVSADEVIPILERFIKRAQDG